jgi:hypothetical protein
MPKQKTHKGTKKRFRVTATGKVKHRTNQNGIGWKKLLGPAGGTTLAQNFLGGGLVGQNVR